MLLLNYSCVVFVLSPRNIIAGLTVITVTLLVSSSFSVNMTVSPVFMSDASVSDVPFLYVVLLPVVYVLSVLLKRSVTVMLVSLIDLTAPITRLPRIFRRWPNGFETVLSGAAGLVCFWYAMPAKNPATGRIISAAIVPTFSYIRF